MISLRKEQLQEIDSKLFFYRLNENKILFIPKCFQFGFVQPGQIKATLQKLLETYH